jgi:hypothetical protein
LVKSFFPGQHAESIAQSISSDSKDPAACYIVDCTKNAQSAAFNDREDQQRRQTALDYGTKAAASFTKDTKRWRKELKLTATEDQVVFMKQLCTRLEDCSSIPLDFKSAMLHSVLPSLYRWPSSLKNGRGVASSTDYEGYSIMQFVSLALDNLFADLFGAQQGMGNIQARLNYDHGGDYAEFFRGEVKMHADSNRVAQQQGNPLNHKKADALVRLNQTNLELLISESGPTFSLTSETEKKLNDDRWKLQKSCSAAFITQCNKHGGYSKEQELLAYQTVGNRFYIYSLSTEYADVMMWCELACYTLPIKIGAGAEHQTFAAAANAVLDLVSASMALAERIVKQINIATNSPAFERQEFLLKNPADVIPPTPKGNSNNSQDNNTGESSNATNKKGHQNKKSGGANDDIGGLTELVVTKENGLVRLADNFENLEVIDLLTERAVRCVPLLSTGETVALKTYRDESQHIGGKYEATQLIRLQQFPFVVRLLDSFAVWPTMGENWRYALILEQLQPLPPLSSMSVAFVDTIISQLLQALAVLHQHSTVHMDIKPANLMLTMDSDAMNDARSVKLKLIDFEYATVLLRRDGLPVQGTRGYMAPELQGKNFCTNGGGGEREGVFVSSF